MLKIGEFSKLARVTVKALRHYDDLGLLRPVEVDQWTGYRYYAASQLSRLNRILALKDLGLSLEQVALALNNERGELSVEQLRGMLKLKRVEIEQSVREEQARLARVEARLNQIEREETAMSDYDVIIKKLEPMTVASIREVVPTFPDVGRLHGELDTYFRQRGVHEASPCLSVWHDKEYCDRNIDAEAAFPIVPGAVEPSDRVKVYTLPGVEQAACVVHTGPYDAMDPAIDAVLSWIGANGYKVAGPNREVYVHNMEHTSDPAQYVTEMQFPVEKA